MDDEQPIKCTCQSCGRTFNYGTECDNEKFCLRCERILFLTETIRNIDLEGDNSMDSWSDEGEA